MRKIRKIPPKSKDGINRKKHQAKFGLISSSLSLWESMFFYDSGSSFKKSWWNPNEEIHTKRYGLIKRQLFARLWHLRAICSICYWYTHGLVGLWSHGRWNTRCFCGILCEETKFLQFLMNDFHTVQWTGSHFHSLFQLHAFPWCAQNCR